MTVDPRTLAADMRDMLPETWPRLHRDAADAIDILVPLHDAWLQAKPPCPTCGGKGWQRVINGGAVNVHKPCPDCPESPGIQPFDKWTAGLVALWTAFCEVVTFDMSDEQWVLIERINHLRQIGGAR